VRCGFRATLAIGFQIADHVPRKFFRGSIKFEGHLSNIIWASLKTLPSYL
jgi:hypothetical protein